ncbi:MAG: CheF family chemotaxis protein [Halodesulfurarchaeum sp.]
MSEGAGKTVECHRCERQAPLDDAVMLKQQHNKALWEYLCAECLADIGVPQGYEVQRDLSHLAADTSPTPSTPEEDASTGEEGPIADFRAKVVTEEAATDEMVPARVVMNRSQIVFVTDGTRTGLRLQAITDVSVGHVPDSAREYFDDVVRLSYRSGERRHLAFVGTDHETLDQFVPLLFSTLLSGTTVRVRNGEERTGMTNEPPIDAGILDLKPEGARIASVGRTHTLSLEDVVHLERRTADWTASGRPVLAVHHHRDGRIHRILIATPTERKRALLGRFLQQEYGGLKQRAAGIELDRPAIECLLCYFAGIDEGSTARVLGVESTDDLVKRLVEADLVQRDAGSPELSKLGRIAVFERFDAIDSPAASSTAE